MFPSLIRSMTAQFVRKWDPAGRIDGNVSDFVEVDFAVAIFESCRHWCQV